MKQLVTLFFLAFVCCTTNTVLAQNITVDDSYTAQQLVENILVNSSCASVSNYSAIGNPKPVGQNSYGFFTNAGGNFPFEQGVVLSTWSVKNSIGPYIFYRGDGNDTNWQGNDDLNQAIGISSTNATVLAFDFKPLTNFLSFDYIFASNEYKGNSPCAYSDGFAFLIKEKGTADVYQNLAVIPRTNIPVSSITIHGDTNGCAAANENYYNGNNTDSSPINYTGQTVVMNAQTTVFAGKTYHIKLVIADDKNEYYDSAVFLKAGSFAPKIDLGPDRIASDNPVCFGESLVLDTKLSSSYTYKWFKNNVELTGETKPFYNVTDNGVYSVEVLFSPATCSASGKINIEYAPEILLTDSTLIQCDDNNDGISIFDLTKMNNIIKNNDSSLSSVVYYESLADAKSEINSILNSTSYTNKLSVPTIFARVTNAFNCANYAKVVLQISNNTITTPNPILTCDGDDIQDGFYQFDLNAAVTPQVLTGLPAGMIVEYYLNSTDAISQKKPLPSIFKNTTANQQTIYARIVNGPDCYGIIPIILEVNTFDPSNFQEERRSLCIGSTITLGVATGFSSYLWNNGDRSNSTSIQTSGAYSVEVTNVNGCKKTKKFTVKNSEIATITGALVNDFAGNENSVLVTYTGVGDYEFSLDGSYFQENPLFIGISPGKYFVYARDKNGCGSSVPLEIYILDYPRFFTPNNDGYNDIWKIKNMDLFPKAVVTIFDRYGKIINKFNANSAGWNGKWNAVDLPADDYWFHLNFGDNKIVKGHFSLKR